MKPDEAPVALDAPLARARERVRRSREQGNYILEQSPISRAEIFDAGNCRH